MEESKAGKYLGNIIHSIKPNLARRLSRGWGKVSEILAVLKEAPLEYYKVKVEVFEKNDEGLIMGGGS